MTPDVRAVYDNYPVWFTHLTAACGAVAQLPLDEMLAANTRMALVGAYIGPGQTEAVSAETAEWHRQVIQHAVTFRDAILDLAGEGR